MTKTIELTLWIASIVYYTMSLKVIFPSKCLFIEYQYSYKIRFIWSFAMNIYFIYIDNIVYNEHLYVVLFVSVINKFYKINLLLMKNNINLWLEKYNKVIQINLIYGIDVVPGAICSL